jgi:glycosyltransferase involved in cell wall biosynthesis
MPDESKSPKRGVASVYVTYWSLRDPLCQTQSLAYLRGLAARGHRFALVTFEQPKYALSPERAAEAKRELAGQGIYWYPLRYHKRFSLLATGFDCLAGVAAGLFAAVRHGARAVHSRASIPAAMALAVSALSGRKFLYDSDSLLSEEYADTGHWAPGGTAYKVTAWFERQSRRRADSVVTLSERLRRAFVEDYGVRAPVAVIPCCVDEGRFRFDPRAREARRAELGAGAETLFVYMGKVGARYLVGETFEFFKAALGRVGPARMLILSGDDPEAFHRIAAERGVGRELYEVRHSAHEDVASWLSAADVGLAFIRSARCERGSSPIKTAEYLAAGLPVVITPGIGDHSTLVEREGVGVVVDPSAGGGCEEGAARLGALLAEGGDVLRARCRRAAERHFSLEGVGVARYEAVYEGLL